jgi:inhibitor of cysteine peptidase
VDDRVLGPADDGRTVEVRPGERIVVELPENATTGYRWEVDTSGLGAVSYADSGTMGGAGGGPPAATRPAPGAAGARRLVFEARGPGEGQIRLRRVRPWEGASSARESYSVTVLVREG